MNLRDRRLQGCAIEACDATPVGHVQVVKISFSSHILRCESCMNKTISASHSSVEETRCAYETIYKLTNRPNSNSPQGHGLFQPKNPEKGKLSVRTASSTKTHFDRKVSFDITI